MMQHEATMEWCMRLLWLIVALSMTGCTTMAIVASGDMPAAIDRLQTGDRIALRTAAGWQEDLRVVSVDPVDIRVQSRGEPAVFARAQVTELRVRRVAPGKTAALAAGILILGQTALCGNPFDHKGGC